MLYFASYSRKSKSAKALKSALGAEDWANFRYNNNDVCIIWGNTGPMYYYEGVHYLNGAGLPRQHMPEMVARACNKELFFQDMSKSKDPPRLPEFTTDASIAVEWGKAGNPVFGRALRNASQGKGILIYGESDIGEFLNCPLFTKFIKSKAEYRVHIFNGEVIDVQKKGLRKEANPEDRRIRSHRNGYVFMRENIDIPPDVLIQAKKAHAASRLDFAAYDVIWNEHYASAYVLEANTAPGLEGTTLDKYVEVFDKIFQEEKAKTPEIQPKVLKKRKTIDEV